MIIKLAIISQVSLRSQILSGGRVLRIWKQINRFYKFGMKTGLKLNSHHTHS